jgi:hypothetical protein
MPQTEFLQGSLDYWDMQWVNAKADALNETIKSAVASVKAEGVPATYVDTVKRSLMAMGYATPERPGWALARERAHY